MGKKNNNPITLFSRTSEKPQLDTPSQLQKLLGVYEGGIRKYRKKRLKNESVDQHLNFETDSKIKELLGAQELLEIYLIDPENERDKQCAEKAKTILEGVVLITRLQQSWDNDNRKKQYDDAVEIYNAAKNKYEKLDKDYTLGLNNQRYAMPSVELLNDASRDMQRAKVRMDQLKRPDFKNAAEKLDVVIKQSNKNGLLYPALELIKKMVEKIQQPEKTKTPGLR